jgi:hypothetical protein
MTKISNQYSLTNILTADLANSRLGINNVSPAYSLDITGTARVSTSAYFATTSGGVGIGTTSPAGSRKLTVAGGAQFTYTDNGGASFNIIPGVNGQDGADFNLSYYTGTGFGPLTFTLAGSERMRITSTGVLGLGVVPKSWYTSGIAVMQFATGGALWGFGASNILLSANEYFDTSGTPRYIDADAATRYQHNAGYHRFSTAPVGTAGAAMTITERLRIHNNGNVTISDTGTDNGYKLFVNGTSAGTSAFQNVSDRRLKKDITLIESALNKVKLLNGVSFNWDKTIRPDLALDDKNHLGLIAQDVEEILPQVVTTGIDELKTKTIAYSDIVPVLIEAIKELSAENTSLINRIEALENK